MNYQEFQRYTVHYRNRRRRIGKGRMAIGSINSIKELPHIQFQKPQPIFTLSPEERKNP